GADAVDVRGHLGQGVPAEHSCHRERSTPAGGISVRTGMSYFTQIIVCDFEFEAAGGSRPNPICMVGRELLGARREWRGGGGGRVRRPPAVRYQRRYTVR